MNLPDSIRDQLRERMWRIADDIDWLALGPTEKTQQYENWTKDPEVGGVLERYMAVGQVRVYIKDSLLKDHPRARRADQDKPFRMLGLDGKVGVTRVFIKPHGRLLSDGRIVCWGRAADWKAILLAVFERSFTIRDAKSFAAILTESAGKYSDTTARSVVIEAAKRLKIEKLIWDS
ncbi:MAG TPA: hypothetical protein VMV10_03190 [Pirellulales bacterium]|nr:hypothetical protein [Pirellulales bacterium]